MKLNKLIIASMAIVLVPATVLAQTSKSDETVSFKSHAYIQGMGGVAHTVGETSFKDLLSPAANLNLGWQISPVFGLRLGGTGWQGKGHVVWAGGEDYSFNYAQGALDVTLDLGNLFAGYNHKRVLNPYIFVGGGAAYGLNNGANDVKVVTPSEHFAYLWEKSLVSPVGRGGVGVDIRLSQVVALTLEANVNVLSDKFNSKKAGNPDYQYNALAGIKINLGKSTRKEVVDNSAELAAAEAARLAAEKAAAEKAAAEKAAAEKAAAEKAAREKALAEAAAAKAARDAAMQKVCTFFALDSDEISAAEAEKLVDYAQWLKENPSVNIAVTGYADVKTGRHSYNKGLSKRRADKVAEFLKDAGIAEDRIERTWKGDTEQPFEENDRNRVVISLVK